MAATYVPKEYGWVLASATSTFLVAWWHSSFVSSYRRQASIAYPRPYADTWAIPTGHSTDKTSTLGASHAAAVDLEKAKAEYLFNCAQRAHGQFMEHLPVALGSLLIAGIAYPLTSAVMGLAWSVNRVLFARGYTRADKAKGSGRYIGIGYMVAEFALIGMVGKMSYDLIMA